MITPIVVVCGVTLAPTAFHCYAIASIAVVYDGTVMIVHAI